MSRKSVGMSLPLNALLAFDAGVSGATVTDKPLSGSWFSLATNVGQFYTALQPGADRGLLIGGAQPAGATHSGCRGGVPGSPCSFVSGDIG